MHSQYVFFICNYLHWSSLKEETQQYLIINHRISSQTVNYLFTKYSHV